MAYQSNSSVILCHDGTILILSLIQIGLNWDCDNFTQSVSETDEALNLKSISLKFKMSSSWISFITTESLNK